MVNLTSSLFFEQPCLLGMLSYLIIMPSPVKSSKQALLEHSTTFPVSPLSQLLGITLLPASSEYICKNQWRGWGNTLNILSLYCLKLSVCRKGLANDHVLFYLCLHDISGFWESKFHMWTHNWKTVTANNKQACSSSWLIPQRQQKHTHRSKTISSVCDLLVKWWCECSAINCL